MRSIFFASVLCVLSAPLVSFQSPSPPVETTAAFRITPNNAFKTGEKLTYRAHYGWITAGECTFYVDKKMYPLKGRNCYHIRGDARSASSFEWFYKLRNNFYTYVDSAAMIPWYYTRATDEGNYKYRDTVSFDHLNKTVKGKQGTFKAPENDYAQDMISTFYYTRCQNLSAMKPGTVVKMPTFLDDKVYEIGLKILGKETIKTVFGKTRCIKIAPILVAGRVFNKDNGMTVWLTDDANCLPVRVESPVAVGSVSIDLKTYEGLRNPVSSKL